MYVRILITATTMVTLSSKQAVPAGNILIMPMPGLSNVYRMASIARELQSFGYNSTFVLADVPIKHKLMTDFNVDVIVSDGFTKTMSTLEEVAASFASNGFRGSKSSMNNLKNFGLVCPAVVQDDADLMKNLQKRKFDIAILSMSPINLCASVIPYKLSVPFIHQEYFVQTMRSMIHPAAYPAHLMLSVTDQMTFFSTSLQYTSSYFSAHSTRSGKSVRRRGKICSRESTYHQYRATGQNGTLSAGTR